jgi:hypothetical protein
MNFENVSRVTKTQVPFFGAKLLDETKGKKTPRFSCPFSCPVGDWLLENRNTHFLTYHAHLLYDAWEREDTFLIVYWTSFVCPKLRNAVLSQLGEKTLVLPAKGVPTGGERRRAWFAELENLARPALERLSRPIGNNGLINNPIFPVSDPCCICHEKANIQLCRDNPSHTSCAKCAAVFIDGFLAKGKILKHILDPEIGMKKLLKEPPDYFHEPIVTPCPLCRVNVARSWLELLQLRDVIFSMWVSQLLHYQAQEVQDLHDAATASEIEEQQAMALRMMEEEENEDFQHMLRTTATDILRAMNIIPPSESSSDSEYVPSDQE